MNIVLYLGCWGRKDEGLVLCSGISNPILDITDATEMNAEIVNYLDKNLQMFDRPLYNNVHTAVFNIQSKFSMAGNPVFKDKYFKLLEQFCIQHKSCGLFLRLVLVEKEQ